MSKYFAKSPATGKYEDVEWRPIPELNNCYNVYLGEWRIGQLYGHAGDWTALSTVKDPKGFRSVEGFARRMSATIYLFKCAGVYKPNGMVYDAPEGF